MDNYLLIDSNEYNSLKGREPGMYGYPTCLNTSSRQATGGAIGESQLPWPLKLTRLNAICHNGVVMPIEMIPEGFAPAWMKHSIADQEF